MDARLWYLPLLAIVEHTAAQKNLNTAHMQ